LSKRKDVLGLKMSLTRESDALEGVMAALREHTTDPVDHVLLLNELYSRLCKDETMLARVQDDLIATSPWLRLVAQDVHLTDRAIRAWCEQIRLQHQPTCTFSAINVCSTCTPRRSIRTFLPLCGAETLTMRWLLLHLNAVSSLSTRATVTIVSTPRVSGRHAGSVKFTEHRTPTGRWTVAEFTSVLHRELPAPGLRLQHDIVMLYNGSHYQLVTSVATLATGAAWGVSASEGAAMVLL